MMYGWYGYSSMTSLIWIAFWCVVAYFIFMKAREGGLCKKENTPLDILKERYAKGEITKEKFEEMKKDLM